MSLLGARGVVCGVGVSRCVLLIFQSLWGARGVVCGVGVCRVVFS